MESLAESNWKNKQYYVTLNSKWRNTGYFIYSLQVSTWLQSDDAAQNNNLEG